MNYFTKSWKGEVSLAKTFWVNNVCLTLSIIAIFVLTVAGAYLTDNVQVLGKTSFISLILLLVICYAVLPWQVVSLWRSSERHIHLTGKQFWARLVQLIVVLNVAYTAASLTKQFHEFKEILTVAYTMGFDDAVTKDPMYSATDEKTYTLSIIDKETLYIDGILQKGVGMEVEKMLEKNPGVKQVMLNSPGGLRNEGQLISKSITKRNLDTVAFENCLSACTEVFASGKYRMIIKDAKLGFHKASFAGLKHTPFLDQHEKTDFENSIFPFWRSQGIKEEFIRKYTNMLNSTDTTIWYPSQEYLRKVNFANAIHV